MLSTATLVPSAILLIRRTPSPPGPGSIGPHRMVCVEFRLLGPIEVLVRGGPVPLGGRQRRTVLAILLVGGGEQVSTDRLIDDLWGDAPPAAARKTVQSHVAHLRKALNAEGEVLRSTGDGYTMSIDHGQLDVRRFERLVEEGRSLRSRDAHRSAEKFAQALSLFRGTPLSGVADDAFSLRVEASRLEDLRLSVREDHLDARLATGEASTVIVETKRLVAEHPLRERLWALLMIALYRAGQQGEALRTFSRMRQVLVEELGIEPSADLRDLEQRILDQDPTLVESVQVPPFSAAPSAPSVRNPYKGLRAFDEDDSADFFGREELVRRLRERMEARGGIRLVVLAGPSGAGKSSVVRGGLIPELRENEREIVVMFPGRDPFDALARAMARVTGESAVDVLDRVQAGGPLSDRPMVVVVDQLEELFTLAEPDDADRFLTLMSDGIDLVQWVATVRTDFLDRLLNHTNLGAVLEDLVVLVPPLQDHEVAAAVTGPARQVGVEVEPELVSEIIRDVKARPGALPLLQFSITDTFERGHTGTLTVADYQAAGGIFGALSRRADELYESMDEADRRAARQLLLALVTMTETGEGVRRRVLQETAMSLSVGHGNLQKVVERLGVLRLLTFDQDPETGQATVEVAHEALITEWPRLAQWVADTREDLRVRQRLSAATREWVGSHRDNGFLLTGSRLGRFAEWASTTDLELASTEQDYLGSSLEAQRLQQRQASRTRRVIAGIVALALVVVTGFGVLFFSQRQATEEQSRIVQAADLAAAANSNLEVDPELSILLALEAVETTRRADGTVLNVAEEALHRAVLSQRLLGQVSHQGEGIAHFSPDGMSFLTSGGDPTDVEVWGVDPFELMFTLVGHTDVVFDAVFDSSGSRIATASRDGSLRVWNTTDGQLDLTFDVEGTPLVPAFSNDGTLLAATSIEGYVRMWNLETEREIRVLTPPDGVTVNLAFSPDDSLLAVTRVTLSLEVLSPLMFDVRTGLSTTLEGQGARDIGFTPDGSRILTAGDDGTVRIWDTESGEELRAYTGHRGPVSALQISADGSTVTSSGELDVKVWDLITLETKAEVFGHSGNVWANDLNPTADLLLTASKPDGTTRLWDLSPNWSRELIGLPNPHGLGGVGFSPVDGNLVTSGATHAVSVWDVDTGQERRIFEGAEHVSRLDIDPTGTFLATAGSGGVELHDFSSGEAIATLLPGIVTLDVDLGPQGMLATASIDAIRLWGSHTGPGEVLSELHGISVAFNPAATVLAMSLSEPGIQAFVEVRELDTGETIATLTEHSTNLVRGLAFNQDGDLLATASDDTTAILWDTTTFELLHRLEGHGAAVLNAVFDPSRPQIATASADWTVKIWDVDTGSLRLTLPAQQGLADLAYSPDGRYLAAIGTHGLVTVFMLDLDELMHEASNRMTRWWTQAECLQYLQTEECPPAP